jgi:hypothetical protein
MVPSADPASAARESYRHGESRVRERGMRELLAERLEFPSVSHQIYLDLEVSICKNLTNRRFCSSPERDLAEGDGYELVRDRSDRYRGH